MRNSSLFVVAVAAIAAGCSTPGVTPPSLQPRSAEAIDPRLPVTPLSTPAPAGTELLTQLAELVRQGRAGNDSFAPAISKAERLAAMAGAPQSESWIAAQQALSAAAAARAPTTRALGDVDAIAARQLQGEGTIAPADQAAVRDAAATLAQIDQAQHARIVAVSRRLGI